MEAEIKQKEKLICPKCKKEMNSLKISADVEITAYLSLDKDGYLDFEEDERGDWENTEYYCSECGETLFKTEEEAISFLKE
jgi:hypothetical protein